MLYVRVEKIRLFIGVGSIEVGFWFCDEIWELVCFCLFVLGIFSFFCYLKLFLREGGGILDVWVYGWLGGFYFRVFGLCDFFLGIGGLF